MGLEDGTQRRSGATYGSNEWVESMCGIYGWDVRLLLRDTHIVLIDAGLDVYFTGYAAIPFVEQNVL